MTKRPLGRGLSALISTDQSRADSDEIREIQIDLIQPGRQQPRTIFDQAKLEELAQSIRTTGIIQPLLVRASGGLFELVAGERRWRAAQLAGLARVPAIVRDIADDNLLELALIENIQREELNPVEEANAYKRLIESLGLTQDEVARRVGRDRTFVTNYLRVLKLPTDIQALLEQDKLTFGHARALLSVQDPVGQRRLAQKIVKHNWSVRETERRVRHLSNQTDRRPSQAVPEHVRGHPHPQPVCQVAQRGLESAVPQRFPGTAPVSHPRRVDGQIAAFLGQVTVEDRPEVAGDRHPVLITGTLEQHRDRRPSPVEVGQPHTQHAVPTVVGMPVAHPLPGAREQQQDRPVTPRPSLPDEQLGHLWIDVAWQPSRLAST